MHKETDSLMNDKDIIHIVSDGQKRGLTPYDALLEAGILKAPDNDFIVNTYDFKRRTSKK